MKSAAGLAAAAPLASFLAACVGAPRSSAAPAVSGASGAAKKLGGKLGIVQWSHFVPEYDTFFDKWAKDWGTKNGVDVTVDHVAIADLPARAAAEVAAKSGHDIFADFAQGGPALYASNNVDISDVCDAVGTKYGGWIPAAEAIGKVNGKWLGLPDFVVPFLSLVRTDLFKQIGFTKTLETWQELLDIAPKLKAIGHPVGTALSNTSDGEHTWRSLMWSYGSYAFSPDGKSVALDSQETRTVLKYAEQLYKTGMTDEVLSWQDVSNNQYLASGKGSWIANPISAYRSIETATPDLAKNIDVLLPLKGPKAQICSIQFTVYRIWNFSKNIDAAKQFLLDYSDNWEAEFTASKGYDNPFLKAHQKKPMPVLGSDPKLAKLQDIPNFVQVFGYPGPTGLAAAETLGNHYLTDMFTAYCTGKKSIDQAISDAAKQIEGAIKKAG